MCTNYLTTPRDELRAKFDLPEPTFEYRTELWPGYTGPIWIRADEWRPAVFGLIPFFSRDGKDFRRTYNARSETVHERPSYRGPWKRRQRCLVPMSAFFEPNYESGKPVRWRIEREDGDPFTVAAIWDTWRAKDAGEHEPPKFSFSMLTVNADRHPLMRRFHAPGDEKRSIVVVPAAQRQVWLEGEDPAPLLAVFDAAEFRAVEDPAPPRKRSVPAKTGPFQA